MADYDDELRERLRAMGERIRAARTTTGLSQEQFADQAGMHRTYIGSVERGERNVSVGSLYVLADALGLSPSELL